MARVNGGDINFNINMTVQKNGLNEITQPLKQIQNQLNSLSTDKIDKEFQEAAASAKQLESIINSSWNDKLGQLNLDKFNQSINTSYGSVAKLRQSLSGAKAAGQTAFNTLAHSVLNTNLQLRESNKLLDDMATTMANTVKWGITSSIFNAVTNSIRSSYYYAKDLDRSLTDIRIVTGDSADQMERFAKTANTAAKDLGRSTLDYTKAALTFYQQGLGQEEVTARTEVTLKAQNITGASAEIADKLTAVWNGFKVGAEQAQLYIDKLAAVADSSASNMNELATAISKTASAANNMGVDIDQLTAQISTVIAATRQAPQSVGTAFKTIYARINDIKTGSEDAEVSLGNYSGKMAQLGFNVLDASGHLRDTGEVIEQIGSRWQDLTNQQQINLAQVMAGQRQYNNLIALFDNWDQYLKQVNISLNAQGTLNEKNDRYLQSLEAHLQSLGTEAQRTYDILFDESVMKGMVDGITKVLGVFNDFIQGLGGGINTFSYFGSFVAGIFNKQIATAILNTRKNIQLFFKQINLTKFKEQYANELLKSSGTNVSYFETDKTTVQQDAIIAKAKEEAKIYAESLKARQGLNTEQQKQLTVYQQQIGKLTEEKYLLENIEKVRAQYGAESLTNIELIKQEEESLKNKEKTQSNILSILKQIKMLEQNQVKTQQDNLKLKQLYETLVKEGKLSKQEEYNLLSGQVNIESVLNDLIQKHQIIYKDINGELQKITNLKELQLALDNGRLQVINGELVVLQREKNELKGIGEEIRKTQKAVSVLSGLGQIMSALGGSIKTFGDEAATAVDKTNAAFSTVQATVSSIGTMFGPMGMGIAALANGAISILKQVTPLGEWVEQRFKTTQDRVQELNQKIKEAHKIEQDYTKKISSLEAVQEEWDTLSEKVEEYNGNINALTDEQKNRYWELIDEFTGYNDAVIAGYDAQGHAIVENQQALKDTIELLRQQRREQQETIFSSSNQDLLKTAEEEMLTPSINAQKQYDEAVQFLKNYKPEDNSDIANSLAKATNATFDLFEENQSIQNQLISGFFIELNKNINDKNSYLDVRKAIKEVTSEYGPQSLNELFGAYTSLYNRGEITKEIEETFQNFLQQFIKGEVTTINKETGEVFVKQLFDPKEFKDYQLNALNILWDDYFGLIQQVRAKRDAAIKAMEDFNTEAEKGNIKFNDSVIVESLMWDPDLDQAYAQLESSPFFNQSTYKSFIDYVSNISYVADYVPGILVDQHGNKWANSYDQIIKAGQEYAQQLYEGLTQYGQAFEIATQDANREVRKIASSTRKSIQDESEIIKESIDNILDNETFKEIFQGDNDYLKHYVIDLIKSIYGVQDLDISKIVDQVTGETSLSASIKTTGEILKEQIIDDLSDVFKDNKDIDPDFINNLVTNLINEQKLDNDTLKLLRDNIYSIFSEENLKDLELNEKNISNLITSFLLDSESEKNIQRKIENFDKILNLIEKIKKGEDLKYKDRLNLKEWLNLSTQDVENEEKIIRAFIDLLGDLGDSEEDALKRIQGVSTLYSTLDEVHRAYDNREINKEEYDSLLKDAFNQELESLGIDQNKLKTFAEEQGINFSKRTKEYILDLYKETIKLDEIYKTFWDNAKKWWAEESEARKKAREEAEKAQYEAAQQRAKDARQRKEEIKEEQQERLKAQQETLEKQQKEELQAAKKKTKIMPNAESALEKLGQRKALSSDEAEALLFLQEKDQTLANIAKEKNFYSDKYIERLRTTLQLQSSLTEETKAEYVAILEKQKADKQAELEKLKSQRISDQQYENAKSYLQQNPNNDSSAAYENALNIVAAYERQLELREKIKGFEGQISELEIQIILALAQGTEEIEKILTASEKLNKIAELTNNLASGKTLSENDLADLDQIIDKVLEEYPQLIDYTKTLKKEWLAGTQAYSEALQEVQNAYERIIYKELNQSLSDAFDQLENDLRQMEDGGGELKFSIDPSDFDQFVSQVETFLQADKEITIAVHTDAQNDFNRINDELTNIYNAAGKIGENFIVAANDIRQLNNVFPGIIQGMQRLDDGSFQLNSNIVQRAIATAQATSGADAQAVTEQLQHQSELLHSKADIYKQMAEAAGVLAGSEIDSDMTAADARAVISKGLQDLKAKNAELASENEMDNEELVAESSKDNSEVVADNWANSSQSAAKSIYDFANSAIANYNSVAQAALAAANGTPLDVLPPTSLPYISSGYTGSGGVNKEAKTLEKTQSIIDNDFSANTDDWAELQQQYQQMYEMTDRAANDIDGMIVQIGARVNQVGQGLQNIVRGQGIKGSSSNNNNNNKSNSGSGSGGKGSSDKTNEEKQEKVKEPDFMEYLEDGHDRYHDIDLEIKAINKDLDKVQKTEKKLYGKDLINNLNKQVELLEKQVSAYKTKIELAIQERDELRNSLQMQGVLFDQNTGAITNYANILSQKLGKVDAVINVYNNLTAEQQQMYKTTVQDTKKNYEEFKKQIENYDTLISETIPGLKDEIRQARDKQVEIAISKFKMAIEIELDLSQAKRNWNEFKKKVINQVRDEDILGNTKATLQNFFSYYQKNNSSNGLIPKLTDQVIAIMNQLDQINSVGISTVYGDNKSQALEDLKNYADELMNSLEDIEDLVKEVEQAFYDMVNTAQDAFDEQNKQYNFLSDLIEHDKKLIQLLYGDEALEKIDNYNQRQKDADKRELNFQKQQKDFWYEKMLAQKTRMQQFNKQSNEYKEAEKRFKELQQHWMDAVNDFNSQIQTSIDHLLDEYKNNVSIIFKDLEKLLTNEKTLDYISEQWELINANADDYLDTINSLYEIEKLQRSFEESIQDNQGNLKAQKSLTDLMNEQLKMLKTKDKLTKYDVERANLLLQIEVKRLALQQSRNNKSKLRLRRDAQGNYSYQYIADEKQVSDAQQDLADARNSLYNLDKDQYIKNQDTILSVQKDFNEKLKALYDEYPIWTEEAEAKREMLIQQYGTRINNLVSQNQHIRLNLTQSAFEELARLYDTDVQNFANMSRTEQQELMNGLIPQWNSGIQTMTDTIAGQGGLIPACQQAFENLDQNTKDYQISLQELEQQAGVSLDQISNGIDTDIDKTEELIDSNKQLIQTYNDEWDALQRIIDQVRALTQTYRTAKEEAIAAAKAANGYLTTQQQNAIQAAEGNSIPSYYYENDDYDLNSGMLRDSFYNESVGILGGGMNTPTTKKAKKKTNTKKSSLIEDNDNNNNNNNGGNVGGATWDRIVQVYNLINSGQVGNDPQRRGNLAALGYNDLEISKGQELINKVYPPSLGGAGMSWDSARTAMGYKTGGYTGDWGQGGKIAVLHEKELVLNSQDTENILSAVQATRNMAQLLRLIDTNNNLTNTLSQLTGQNYLNTDQSVYITASFPAVNSRLEIEEAFSNLINRASQYSFNTRK